MSSAAISSAASTAAAAALQEASETAATTMQEAARGDRQAVRLLAREQQNQVQPAPAKGSAQGSTIDHLA
jgi:hypothetical protein